MIEDFIVFRSFKRPWYRRKEYVIPLCIFIILCLLAIILGSTLGSKSHDKTVIYNSNLTNCSDLRFSSSAITVAGGNDIGFELNQLSSPDGFFLDKDNTIYIADCNNHRIMKWINGASNGIIVAGSNQAGNRTNEFDYPIDLTVDQNGTMYITDFGNQRVLKWFSNATHGQISLSSLIFTGIGLDDTGAVYTSDWSSNSVKKWRTDQVFDRIVAFGLNSPDRIFVDQNHSVYVADRMNHRIIKISIGTTEKLVVAGGIQGSADDQLDSPRGVTVDRLGNVYVADTNNHRIMRWNVGAKKGILVAGGNDFGFRSDQLNTPTDLQFDSDGNLYVADSANNRIQKFLSVNVNKINSQSQNVFVRNIIIDVKN